MILHDSFLKSKCLQLNSYRRFQLYFFCLTENNFLVITERGKVWNVIQMYLKTSKSEGNKNNSPRTACFFLELAIIFFSWNCSLFSWTSDHFRHILLPSGSPTCEFVNASGCPKRTALVTQRCTGLISDTAAVAHSGHVQHTPWPGISSSLFSSPTSTPGLGAPSGDPLAGCRNKAVPPLPCAGAALLVAGVSVVGFGGYG